MDKQQIKNIINKRSLKPIFALVMFNLICSISLRYLNSIEQLSIYAVLTFIAINILFLFALMLNVLAKVLSDLTDKNKENKEQIEKTVTKHSLKPGIALVIFHIIGSVSLRHLSSTNELNIHVILTFIVMNVFFLFALILGVLGRVLTDLKDIENNGNQDETF